MQPRIILLATANVCFDLLVIAAASALLLGSSAWLAEVGVARFCLVAAVIAIGLVPMMYAAERAAVARAMADAPDKVTGNLPAWAGMERTVRA